MNDYGSSHNEGHNVEAIIDTYRDRLESKRVQFAPDIDSRKLTKALETYGENVAPGDVLALIDTTLLGGAKDGALVTATALHTHDVLGDPHHVPLDQITSIQLNRNKVVVNDAQILDIGTLDDEPALVEMLLGITTGTPAAPQLPAHAADKQAALESKASLVGQVVPCMRCGELRPAERSHTVYTAIRWTSRAHTEQFKTYQTVSKTFLYQERTFGICEQCCRHYRLRAWLLLGAATAVIAYSVAQWIVLGNLTGWQFLWPLGITIVAAIVLSGRFAETEVIAKREAVKQRTPGARQEVAGFPPLQTYRDPYITVTVLGFDEQEFAKARKQLEKTQAQKSGR